MRGGGLLLFQVPRVGCNGPEWSSSFYDGEEKRSCVPRFNGPIMPMLSGQVSFHNNVCWFTAHLERSLEVGLAAVLNSWQRCSLVCSMLMTQITEVSRLPSVQWCPRCCHLASKGDAINRCICLCQTILIHSLTVFIPFTLNPWSPWSCSHHWNTQRLNHSHKHSRPL